MKFLTRLNPIVAIIAAALFIVAARCAHGTPTTKPSTNPSYLQGWRDAGGQVEQPPVELPDLDKLFAIPGPPVKIPKGTYTLRTTAKPVRDVDGQGSTLIPPVGMPCIEFTHDGAEVGGFVTAYPKNKAAIFCVVSADDCRLFDCNVTGCVNIVKNMNGRRFKAERVGGVANSVGIYTEQPCTLNECSPLSLGEYGFRASRSPTSDLTEKVVIIGGFYTNKGNLTKHDTAGFRGLNGIMTGVAVEGNIRVGQSNQPPTVKPGDWSKTEIYDCHFGEQSPGHNYIEILQGGELWETGNTFAPAKDPNIALTPKGGAAVHHEKKPATQPVK